MRIANEILAFIYHRKFFICFEFLQDSLSEVFSRVIVGK